MTDLGVHRVGEVNRSRTGWQDDDLTLRGEDVHLVPSDLVAQRIQELLRITRLALHLNEGAQPVRLLLRTHAIRVAARGVRVLLVLPVRGDTVFRALVHVIRANLDLHRLAARTNDRRVQRLVEVELGHRDVVFEAARDRVPPTVQGAENAIAVLDRVHQHTHGDQVEDLVESLASHNHLLVDRIVALRATTDRALRTRAAQILFDLVDDVTQVLFTLRGPLRNEAVNLLVDFRIQGLEGKLLEFPLDHVHTEAVSQRRVDLQRLLRLLRRRLGRNETPRAGVMDAIGQLNEQHADVAAHGDEHLAQRLGLSSSSIADLVELGDAVDQIRDGFTEVGGQFLERVVRVFHGVMQQCSNQRRGRHSHLGKDRRYGHRMGDIRLARLAHLPTMAFFSLAVGPLHHADIRLRMIRAQSPHKRLNLGDRGASTGPEPHEAGAHSGDGRGQCGP